MAISRWLGFPDPFAELGRLQGEMNRLFDNRRWAVDRPITGYEFPPVSVTSAGDVVTIAAELPGMELGDIELSVTGNAVTIRGERKDDGASEGAAYLRRERVGGAFARTIQLPERVNGEKAEARYENGVLTVRIPKAEEARSRKIQIKPA